MLDKQKNVGELCSEVVNEMCDKYCKFPEQYAGEDEDKLYKERCDNCPLNKLI